MPVGLSARVTQGTVSEGEFSLHRYEVYVPPTSVSRSGCSDWLCVCLMQELYHSILYDVC